MFKRLLLSFIVIFTLFILADNLYSQGCNCFNGWLYRVPVTITNANALSYTNFEIRDSINTAVLVTAGKMKADGSDIRFADSLCNPLSYYIESGINTTGTIIWVKVPSLPASGTRIIYMYYGNPAATAVSNPLTTFAFFEGFDNNTLGRFTLVCSSGTPSSTFSSGVATFSWTSSAIWASDSTLINTEVYTTEANVTAATGNWPGLYNIRNTGTHQSMALLMGSGSVRVSKTPIGGTTDYCNGHNFVNPTQSAATPAGIWAFTWIAQGSQAASFPGPGTWATTDAEQPKDVPLKIGLGGISGGTGSYSIDWVRARKYAPIALVAANGSELAAPNAPSSLTATVLGSTSIRINWVDNSSNEDKFMIDRSTNGGSNWTVRDSVAANTTQYTDGGLTQNTQYCYRVYAKNCVGISANSNQVCSTTTFTGIVKHENEIPKVFNLYQNYPNPFNPSTNIKFDIPKSSYVKLAIYDVIGKQVYELVNSQLAAGSYSVDWNTFSFASGVYFYRIEAGDYVQQMKMVLVK